MIKPIVEGHGEVEAVPVLLRRLAHEWFDVFDVGILRPGRYPAGRLLRKRAKAWEFGPDLEKACRHARNEGAEAIMIVLDIDDDCAEEVIESLTPSLGEATTFDNAKLVFAVREFEGWLLASAETLEPGVNSYEGNPESVRDAKGKLEEHLGALFYDERSDQPRYAAKMDFSQVYRQCRSFRKFVKDFALLLQGLGRDVRSWEP